MVKSISKISLLFILLVSLSIQSSISFEMRNQDLSQQVSTSPQISPDYGKIPLYFIPNEGQVNEKALFYAKASRYTLWLTEEGLVFDTIKRKKRGENQTRLRHPKDKNNPEGFICERDASTLVFLNSKKNPDVVPEGQTEHKVNYFLGKDNSKWRTNIQTSRAVLYKELYQNIDLRIYGIERHIEYDFIVRPEGEASDISFEYRDAIKTEIDKNGNLVVETTFGELEHEKPECYQVIGGKRIEVEAGFRRIEANTYGFKVEEYNRNYELIIDPLVLVYSTYLGGNNWDFSSGIAVDSEGAAYVTGYTGSADFPTQNPIQEFDAVSDDAFITKVNSSGSALIYSTYLGGSNWDASYGIAVDSEGAAYVTGETFSNDFPTQNPIQGTIAGSLDAFITKVSPSGSALIYSTYLGGSDHDDGRKIAMDTQGAVYITGNTLSTDFPTQNAIQGNNAGGHDAFITKVNSSGSALIYSTYLGGSDHDYGLAMAVDTEGAAYVTGYTGSTDFPIQNPIQGTNAGYHDAYITKVDSSGSALIYSTYLGGYYYDESNGIAVDSEGAAYVTGCTGSNDFPTKNAIQGTYVGGFDAFITKVNSTGSDLIYSTYLGGYQGDNSHGIAVDSEGAAYVTGETLSINFPTKNPIQGNRSGGSDAFITKVNSSGSDLIYSTYLGGSWNVVGMGIAVDSEGAAYVTGETNSDDFPTKNPIQGTYAGQYDAFIARLNFTYFLILAADKGGTTDPSPGIYTYIYETEVSIEAKPDPGYKFSNWSGDASGAANPITITVDSDKTIKTIKANFKTKGIGCFVATAAYNSPFHPHIETLRDFRDKYLMPNEIGRKIVEFYYKYSPFVANMISKSKLLKLVVRINLTPFVVISYSMVHLGPINTGAILFLLILPIFLMSVLRRR